MDKLISLHLFIRHALLSLGIGAAVSCGFYTMPTLDLVVHLGGTAREDAVRQSVEEFVQAKGLQEFDLGTPGEPAGVEEQRARATHWRNPESTSDGIGVMYFDLAPDCKVVRLLEQSENWTQESRFAVVELERRLSGIAGARVERGNSLEDWYVTMRSPESHCSKAQVNAR